MFSIMMRKRLLQQELQKTILSRPVVYLKGPRQVGKSTLVQNLKIKDTQYYTSFDSPLILEAAKSNPSAFIKGIEQDALVILDEIQMVPELFRYLKIAVDEARQKGKNQTLLLLTGSANLLALPSLSDALVGRMSVLDLYPFSASEYFSTDKNFIADLFESEFSVAKVEKSNLLEVIKNSTFPEISLGNNINRIKWFDDYLTTIIQRDVKTLSDIRHPEKIITLLSVLSHRAGAIMNDSAVCSEVGLDRKTYEKYKAQILNTFLAFEVLPWTTTNNYKKRFIKSPKIYFTDTNMLSYIMRRDLDEIAKNDPRVFGYVFENFVATEILKQTSILPEMNFYHFRTIQDKEVDFVVERNNGDVIAIEVKASSSIKTADIKGILEFQSITQDKFKKGIILYTGEEIVPFGNKIWAMPVDLLWQKI